MWASERQEEWRLQEAHHMANQKQYYILRQGVNVWNRWREKHTKLVSLSRRDLDLNLTGADLSRDYLIGANLSFAKLQGVNLSSADLSRANRQRATCGGTDLRRVNLSGANLSGAALSRANLSRTNLSGIDLSGASLSETNLRNAILRGTNLSGHNFNNRDFSEMDFSGANLNETSLIKTNFSHANLSNCSIYGIAAWDIQFDEQTIQKNLIITPPDQPAIMVDNLKIAQFIYLLLNNAEIRDAIDTIARKAVLILGRFTPPRKAVLDALREALRVYGFLPILFDFEKPSSRNFTETVRTLAHLSRFIIADLTDPSSIPQELQAIIPTLRVPVQPVLLEGKKEYAMFVDFFESYHWEHPIHYYTDQAHLLATLKEQIITPAEQKAQELKKQ
jgi:uncharacterized protein YjbI with pentapeptide repeats